MRQGHRIAKLDKIPGTLIMWFYLTISIAFLAVVYLAIVMLLHRRYPETQWQWDDIDTENTNFPPGFLWGTATAAHQVDGGNDNNNWSRWEQSVDERGRPRVHNGDRAGNAAEHWERYPEDFQRMRDELGVGSYRFSIEWSRVEPQQGTFDASVIEHYHNVIDKLLALGIEPMVTLHHFTNPLWFEDMGAFENEENIDHFVTFSQRMFSEYGQKVKRWCTINESCPYAMMGYGLGVFPPGVKNFRRMAHVLHHLMLAHVRVYETLKAMPGGDKAEIGLVKNIFQFDPYQRWNLFQWIFCRILEGAYNDSVIGFLRDGVFKVHIPTQVNLRVAHPEAIGKTDFIGLNYYANLLISLFMKREPPFDPNTRPGQIVTDMPYTIYAEGFYRALHQISTIGKPIIVTENGIADDKDDRRAIWIERYLYAMSRAIEEGCDVRGYHYWSLLDNFEWAEGYQMRFGLFEVDYQSQERRLRDGAKPFVDAIARAQKDA